MGFKKCPLLDGFKCPLTEYDHIKKHFHKILGRKTIEINAEIIIDASGKINANANSSEIDSINKDFIQTIYQKRIQRAIKINYNKEIKKSLFTAEELLSENDSLNQVGNVFKKSEKDIIKSVLSMQSIRNKRQIEHLSGYDLTDQIFITLRPNFGFLFLIRGLKCRHFCWELPNSNATYIWTITNSLSSENQLNQIKDIISFIQETGRNHYRNEKHPELDDNVRFNYLNHTNIETKTEDSFNIWKRELLGLVE